jgi:hypothetical protein
MYENVTISQFTGRSRGSAALTSFAQNLGNKILPKVTKVQNITLLSANSRVDLIRPPEADPDL